MTSTNPKASKTLLGYYVIRDGGDGSASASFFKTAEEAAKVDEYELETMGIGCLTDCGPVPVYLEDFKDKFDPEE